MLSVENFFNGALMSGMVLVDSIYLRRHLIVQRCGYFLIHLVLMCPKNMFVFRVYQQIILYFCRIWDSFIASFIFKTYKSDTFFGTGAKP